ncbi:hypothetical protein ABBQ32_005301 [Trebouxia sp. C0010 RCD-2024]
MPGAIDIMVVSQPDGSLRSSPFYVRFGKYTGLRIADKKVHIVVNDIEADFTMHLGRSGEAYFVGEDDVVGDSDEEGDLLAGIMSPPNEYSSPDEALSFVSPQQTATIQAALAQLGQSPGFKIQAAADNQAANDTPPLRASFSSSTVTDILSVPPSLDTSLSAPPGDPTLIPIPSKHPNIKSRFLEKPSNLKPSLKPPLMPRTLESDGPLTPHGLGCPTTPKHSPTMGRHAPQPWEPSFQGRDISLCVGAEEGSQAGSCAPQPARSHLTIDLAAAMQQEEDRRASNAQAESSSSPTKSAAANDSPSRQTEVLSSPIGTTRAAHQQKATPALITPFQLASQSCLDEQGPASPPEPFSHKGVAPRTAGQHTVSSGSKADTARSNENAAWPVSVSQNGDRHIPVGRAELSQPGGCGAGPAGDGRSNHKMGSADSSHHGDIASHTSSAVPPAHPWSVTNPRFLATPTGSQPPTLTMQASAAAAPVGPGSASASAIASAQQMAISQAPPQANTAIPAAVPIPEGSEDGSPRAGNRVELEALLEQVHHKQTAQMAMLTAHKERLEWDHEGGQPPLHSHFGQEAAIAGDLAAAQASHLSEPALDTSSSSSSTNSHESLDSPPETQTQTLQSPWSAHHASGSAECAHQLRGGARRTPMSPQPSRPPPLALTRQLSQSAPSSPHRLPPSPSGNPSGTPSDAPNVANTKGPISTDDAVPGGIQIPTRAGQQGWGDQLTHASAGGSEGGLLGPLNGVSLPDGYMADTEVAAARHRLHHPSISFTDSGRLVGAGSSAGGHAADAWASLAGFEISLCGDHLSPAMSPVEAYQAFQAHRVSEPQFTEHGPLLVTRPSLMCRLGDRILPWTQAAPVVMGVLAFGGDWQNLLLPDQGVPVAVPPQQTRDPSKAKAVKSSSWRVWLGSWRSGGGRTGKPGSGGLDAAVAAAAAATHPNSPAAQQLALEALGSELSPPAANMVSELVASQQGRPPPGRRRAFVPSPAQLKALPLQYGQNTIDFIFAGQRQRAYIHFFNWNSRLVISDIDGTITKSDLLGHLLPRVGYDWSHRGVTRLFTNIKANGYVFMFLSSRAIAQASATRDYLHTLNQDGETLPAGPVIISPDGLFPSLYRELVLRRPHEFKIRCLEDIRALFPSDWNPFYAGFGNRDTDEISYLTVGVPASKCFIINPKGELRKASSAVATSTWGSLTSVNTIVQAMFPPLQQEAPHATPEREEYNDYNYWHVTPPIIIDSEDDAFGDPEGDQYESDSDEDSYHHFL